MSNKPFEKFIHKEVKGAKKKEKIRQEKKHAKAEAQAFTDEIKKKNAARFGLRTNKDVVAKKSAPTESNITSPPSGAPFKKRGAQIQKTSRYVNNRQPEITKVTTETEQMPLNKFVAHAGICGRREAAELVKQGKVIVNGDIIYEPGFKVTTSNKIEVNGKRIHPQKNLVYILINKPKDYITTAKDPEGRKTIFDLLRGATPERIYPVGRLDRNTTGVLLLTNDGELAQKLTHPSYEIKKIYEVKLDKPVTKNDLDALQAGIMLEDGFIQADMAAYADSKDKSVIGIEIHSGRNRIVRRMFEHLGYDVRNLDRVMFANLTKKNVERGKWRFLNEKEVRLLKYMNQSFVRNKKE